MAQRGRFQRHMPNDGEQGCFEVNAGPYLWMVFCTDRSTPEQNDRIQRRSIFVAVANKREKDGPQDADILLDCFDVPDGALAHHHEKPMNTANVFPRREGQTPLEAGLEHLQSQAFLDSLEAIGEGGTARLVEKSDLTSAADKIRQRDAEAMATA